MSTAPLYLLDTNVVIHYARGKAVGEQIEKDYSLTSTPYRPLICVVTKGEVLAFAAKRNWGERSLQAAKGILASFVSVDISDDKILEAYAAIDSISQDDGKRMGKNDLWIAAVAHVSQASLMTTDDDFKHLAGSMLNLIRIDSNTGQTR
jgi:tRNA(fMet)-specific endonuclease VapC